MTAYLTIATLLLVLPSIFAFVSFECDDFIIIKQGETVFRIDEDCCTFEIGATATATDDSGAIAAGCTTTAEGQNSNAFNLETTSVGDASSAFGSRTESQSYANFVVGVCNEDINSKFYDENSYGATASSYGFPLGDPRSFDVVDWQEGLVAAYLFNDEAPLSDSSPNNHDLTLGAGATISSGVFTGTNDNGDDSFAEPDAFLISSNALTLAAWIKPASFDGNEQQRIIAKNFDQSTPGHYFMLGTRLSGGKVVMRARIGTDETASFTVLGDDEIFEDIWQHVAVIYQEGQAIKMYLNGVEIGTDSTFALTGTVDTEEPNKAFRIGSSTETCPSSNCRGFDGEIDNVFIFDRALSAEEMMHLVAGTATLLPEYNLEGWWKFDSGDTAIAYDSSANERHGTYVANSLLPVPILQGKVGGAVEFSNKGSDTAGTLQFGAIDLGTFNVQDNEQLTIMAWIYPGNEIGEEPRIISKADGIDAVDHDYMLSLDGQKVRFRVGRDSFTGKTSNDEVTFFEWQHVAVRWRVTGDWNIFVNGEIVNVDTPTATTSAITSNGNAVHIGANPDPSCTGCDDNFKAWDGMIDEVQVYSRWLSDAEIKYFAESCSFQRDPLFVAGNGLRDSSGCVTRSNAAILHKNGDLELAGHLKLGDTVLTEDQLIALLSSP